MSDEAAGAAAHIRVYDDATDRAQVIALWNSAFSYTSPHNLPEVSIDLKLRADDGLFFVAVQGGQVVGTVLSGYDGHRGWLYSVAVAPEARNRGLGTRMVRHAEQAMVARGCLKINLQILESNAAVVAFYERLGYVVEPRINMGRRLGVWSA